jgi:hypothetical protein
MRPEDCDGLTEVRAQRADFLTTEEKDCHCWNDNSVFPVKNPHFCYL